MTTSAAHPFCLTETCPACQRPVGPKHAELCTGPRQCRVPSCTNHARHGGLCGPHYDEDQEGCDCPPGAWHLRDCPKAYWPEGAV